MDDSDKQREVRQFENRLAEKIAQRNDYYERRRLQEIYSNKTDPAITRWFVGAFILVVILVLSIPAMVDFLCRHFG